RPTGPPTNRPITTPITAPRMPQRLAPHSRAPSRFATRSSPSATAVSAPNAATWPQPITSNPVATAYTSTPANTSRMPGNDGTSVPTRPTAIITSASTSGTFMPLDPAGCQQLDGATRLTGRRVRRTTTVLLPPGP